MYARQHDETLIRGPPPNPSVIGLGLTSSGDSTEFQGAHAKSPGGDPHGVESQSAGISAGGAAAGDDSVTSDASVARRDDGNHHDPGGGVGDMLESGDGREDAAGRSGTTDGSSFVPTGPAPLAPPAEAPPHEHNELGARHADYPDQCAPEPRAARAQESDVSPEQDNEGMQEPEHVFNGLPRLYVLAYIYAEKGPAKCPVFFSGCGLLMAIFVISFGLAGFPLEIDTSFDSFLRTDVNASTMRDGFLHAFQERESDRRLNAATDLFRLYDFHVAYELNEKDSETPNLLQLGHLQQIAAFEKILTSIPEYLQLCAEVREEWQVFCRPGVSLANFAMPSLEIDRAEIVPKAMTFDGKGRELIPTPTMLKIINTYKVDDVVMPSEYSPENPAAAVLRSSFRFKVYCCTSIDPASVKKNFLSSQDQKWHSFVEQTLLPFLQENPFLELWNKGKKSTIKIYYEGTAFQGIEVMGTLARDSLLATGSLTFVLLYLLVHTRSFLLSLSGIIIIGMSVPLAYVVLAICVGTSKMSIASFLSLFLIVGLGSDVVFVYTDFWRESMQVKDTLVERIAWTYFHAGKASLATTATTAISFVANLASVLKPLREFGLFMALCVWLVWMQLTFTYVPLCVLDDQYMSACRLRMRHVGIPGVPQGRTIGTIILEKMLSIIHSHKKKFLGVPAVIALVMFIWALSVAETDTSVPNIFPEDHNQNRGKQVMAVFKATGQVFDPLFVPPPPKTDVCNEQDFDQKACVLYWCEVMQGHKKREDGQCECYRREEPARGSCSVPEVSVKTRIVGPEITRADMEGQIGDYLDGGGYGVKVKSPRRNSMSSNGLAPMILNEWESGSVDLHSATEISSTMTRDDGGSCGWHELCFCGIHACKLPSLWRRTYHDPIQLEAATQLGSASSMRFLQAQGGDVPKGTVPVNLRAMVDVVFGIEVDPGSPLVGEKEMDAAWKFQITHEARQPWAQRNMLAFCQQLPENLVVMEKRCWIEHFHDWVKRQNINERFPVPAIQFDHLVISFAESSVVGLVSAKEYMWIRNGEVRASFMSFAIDVASNANTWTALEHMELWDNYLSEFNREASRFTKGAWHVSELWVRAQAHYALISSTVLTFVLVIVLAFLGMLAFTKDLFLSLYVVCATVSVVTALAWFIVGLMGWRIGPIEVIALIVFIGYAVTYSLHIAHKYGSDEALFEDSRGLEGSEAVRYQRTNFAMRSIGVAAVGSAVTTIGCSIFLLFCTLTIFQKLGGVVLAVTLFSIFTALVPLPAALLMFGPVHPGCGKCQSPQEVLETWANNVEAAQKTLSDSSRIISDGSMRAYSSIKAPTMPKMPNLPKRASPSKPPPPPPVPPPKVGASAVPRDDLPAPKHGKELRSSAPSSAPTETARTSNRELVAASVLPQVGFTPEEVPKPKAKPKPKPPPAKAGPPEPKCSRSNSSDADFEIGVESSLQAIHSKVQLGGAVSPVQSRGSPRMGGVASIGGMGIGGAAVPNIGGVTRHPRVDYSR